jgi:hypothetical protein
MVVDSSFLIVGGLRKPLFVAERLQQALVFGFWSTA